MWKVFWELRWGDVKCNSVDDDLVEVERFGLMSGGSSCKEWVYFLFWWLILKKWGLIEVVVNKVDGWKE